MDDTQLREALRNILDQAHNEGHLVIEEVNFVNRFVKKIDKEIERKTIDRLRLEGEIQQLRLTKRLIVDLIKDSVAATERAKVREETMTKLRSGENAREKAVIEEKIVDEKKPETVKRKRKKKEDK
jgi:hypothetical protein